MFSRYGKVATMAIAILLGLIATVVRADNKLVKNITNGKCTEVDFKTIPVGNFYPPMHLPEENLHLNQKYNTTHDEGYCSCDPPNPSCKSASASLCASLNGKWMYGHTGLDVDGESESPGVNDVKAVMPGIVVLSYDVNHTGGTSGWGESIIVATRANEYSDEIITHHYHHMYRDNTATTRQFNACEEVNSGDILGKEDDTGNSKGSHLHLGIRRWKNIKELTDALKMGGYHIFGTGYTFGDNTKIAKNLDPEGILFDTFLDYHLDGNGNPPAYGWSLPYVLAMRHRGIEFGLFDGRYGAGQEVTRREAARWLKIAAQRHNQTHKPATFADVPPTDSDFPYIETLTTYPSRHPVINKDASITGGQRYFHPDDSITRAQALKMVILSFYSSEFLEFYNNFVWNAAYGIAKHFLSKFQDVSPFAWYASYVYFGVQKGLVAIQPNFFPENHVKREEMAKWVSEGAALIEGETSTPCDETLCPADYYCESPGGQCVESPTCVPSETQECEIGGGYTGNDQCSSTPECTPGQTQNQSCNGNGTQTRTCDSNCVWGSWSNCVNQGACTPNQTAGCGNCGTQTCNGNSQWGACQNQGACSPGQTQQQSCNGIGTQTRICQGTCHWGSWGACSVNPVCSPGQTQQQSCTTANNQPGTQTRTCDANGQWGGWGACVQSCTDVYLADSTMACASSGGYNFCMYVQQVSGSNWQYQVCKQGGLFLNNYKTILLDGNHMGQLGDTYLGNAGDVCINPWRPFSVSYLNGYGPVNGAGVRAEVLLPSNCGQASCTYSTGIITVRKECQ